MIIGTVGENYPIFGPFGENSGKASIDFMIGSFPLTPTRIRPCRTHVSTSYNELTC